mgnify:CR=1 FL=1
MMEIQSESWKRQQVIIPSKSLEIHTKTRYKSPTSHPHSNLKQIPIRQIHSVNHRNTTILFPFLQSIKCVEIQIQSFIHTIQIIHPNAAAYTSAFHSNISKLNLLSIQPTITQTQTTPLPAPSAPPPNHSHPLFPTHSNHMPQSHTLPPIITILSPFTPTNQYKSHIPSNKPHQENPPSTHITQQTPHNHTRYNTGDRNTTTKNPTEYT